MENLLNKSIPNQQLFAKFLAEKCAAQFLDDIHLNRMVFIVIFSVFNTEFSVYRFINGKIPIFFFQQIQFDIAHNSWQHCHLAAPYIETDISYHYNNNNNRMCYEIFLHHFKKYFVIVWINLDRSISIFLLAAFVLFIVHWLFFHAFHREYFIVEE